MTKDERLQWRITRRITKPPYDLAWEIQLHARYSALRALGWTEVIWCEGGAYFIPNTIYKPDFSDKHRILLSDFDAMLTNAELLYAKRPPQQACEVASSVSLVQRA